MTILNVTTFVNTCKNRLVYYKSAEYHLFTNGMVLYACKDGNPNLQTLLDRVTNDSTGRNQSTFEPILDALNNKPRAYVVDHEEGASTTKVITNFNETKGMSINIDKRYYKTIKKNAKKEFFLIKIQFMLKTLDCYFAESLTQDEFILIMPIIQK